MKILIIEDEEPIRQTLRDLLEINGHEVLAAADGDEGIARAEARPDLVLCDVNMPKVGGFQVLEAFQARPHLREIPFIFLTALADRESMRRGMALGADDYLTKPFTEREILDAIAARQRRQQSLQERLKNIVSERRAAADAEWSHELMTPLTGIMGGLELIEAEAETIRPEELRELLGIIRAGAERQLALAKKLVLYNSLERLRLAPRPGEECDAADAVAAGVGECGPDPRLVVRCDHSRVTVNAANLAAAVRELVRNALFFGARGKPVTVTGSAAGGSYRLEVADEGVGMTPEQCREAGPFRQFDRGRHNQQGLGIGLAIARAVAEISGGRMELAPGPDGRGLRVTLELPGG